MPNQSSIPKVRPVAELSALRARVRELETLNQVFGQRGGQPPLHLLLENSPDTITVMDRECRFLYLNRTLPPHSVADLLGRSGLDYLPEEYRAPFQAAFERSWHDRSVEVVEVRTVTGYAFETRLVPLQQGGTVSAIMGISTDVTQRRLAEEALRDIQKLDALGRISAELAHDFNNLLLVILTNLGLCKLKAAEELRSRLQEAEHAAHRAAELVRRLMTFAVHRQKPRVMRPERLETIAERTLGMCRTTLDSSIAIALEVAGELPPVHVDAGEIEQVLLNLLLNARDALAQGGAGAPQIRVLLDLAQMPRTLNAAPRAAVRLRVRDNGPGMTESVRARVFEPFFTTKPENRGTGLGLAAAYGTMADHGGMILCESQPGAGATFSLLFPAPEPATR